MEEVREEERKRKLVRNGGNRKGVGCMNKKRKREKTYVESK